MDGKGSSVLHHLLKEIGIVDKINVVFVDTKEKLEPFNFYGLKNKNEYEK